MSLKHDPASRDPWPVPTPPGAKLIGHVPERVPHRVEMIGPEPVEPVRAALALLLRWAERANEIMLHEAGIGVVDLSAIEAARAALAGEPLPAPAGEPEPLTETLTWHDAETDPPDMDLQVLMAFEPEAGLSVDTGWLDIDGWHYCESGAITQVPPKWWAHVPAGPQC